MCFLLVGKSHQIPPRVPAPTCVYNQPPGVIWTPGVTRTPGVVPLAGTQ